MVFAFRNPPRDPATALVEPVSCIASALPAYNIMSGDRVLLLGAGYMGLLNVIGLAHTPISELVVTDIKEKNLELARSFGATHTINTGTEEGRAEMQELTPFDLVVECAGIQATVDEGTRLTRSGGRLSIFSWHHQPRSVPLGAWHIKGLTVTNVGPAISTDLRINFMERAVRLIDCGMFDQSDLITHRHSWKDARNPWNSPRKGVTIISRVCFYLISYLGTVYLLLSGDCFPGAVYLLNKLYSDSSWRLEVAGFMT